MDPLQVLRDCVREADGDLAAAVLACDYILSTDAQGHEHRGKGEGGGQFTSKPGNTGDKRIGKVAPKKEHDRVIDIGTDKLTSSPKPTDKEVRENLAGMKLKGANKFRKDLIGNSTDRKKRRDKLLEEFGDGVVCPCLYCGVYIGHGTLEQDKIYTTAQGGRYRVSNLVPACSDCNKRRGDMPFSEALNKAVRYAANAKITRERNKGKSPNLSIDGVRSRGDGSNGESLDSSIAVWGFTPVLGGWCTSGPDDSAISGFLAHDIHNRTAQGILNRTLQATRGLNKEARRKLSAALKEYNQDGGAAVEAFVDEHRLALAKLLTSTQLAALLEGMREVASAVPVVATFPGAVPLPPALSPSGASALVERIAELEGNARWEVLYELPTDQQIYVQQALAAKEAGPVATLTAVDDGSVHLPIIDEAVRELSSKNLLTRESYDALGAAARAKAFTVAGVESEATLKKVRDAIADNVRKGADYAAFKQAVLDAVDQGTFLSEPHMETVYRTNVQTAFSDGQAQVLSDPHVRSGFPYATYDAIHDDQVRDNHLALEKLGIGGSNVYRIDDPVFKTFRPPWDYSDRCSWTPTTVRQAAEMGVEEAKTWLSTGREPSPPAYVTMPAFRPPEGFQRELAHMPLSVQLSLQPTSAFKDEPRDAHGRWTAGGAKARIRSWLKKAAKLPAEALQYAKRKVKSAYSKLEEKHGPRWAKVIVTVGIVTFPTPFTTGAVLATCALAKLSRRYFTEVTAEETKKAEKPGKKFVQKLADSLESVSIALAVHHAPEGGVTIQGKFFEGGQFIPADVVAQATPEEKAQLGPGRHEVGTEVTYRGQPGFKIAGHHKNGKDYILQHIATGAKKPVTPNFISPAGGKAEAPKAEEPKEGKHPIGAKVKHRGNPGFKVVGYHKNGKDYILQHTESGAKKPVTPGSIQKEDEGGGAPAETGGQVAETPEGEPSTQGPSEPAREATFGSLSREDVNRRIDRYSKFFRDKGQGKIADWLDVLRDHVNTVGTDAALAALGEEIKGKGEEVQYAGYVLEGRDAAFIEAYLDRNGINLMRSPKPEAGKKVVSAVTPGVAVEATKHTPGFVPSPANLVNKLREAQHLPGLESSQDLAALVRRAYGARVPHFTPEVLATLDRTYGKGKWVVKSYGDEAYAGYGVFFPQRIQQLHDEALNVIANSKAELNKYGFDYVRQDADDGFAAALAGQIPVVDEEKFKTSNNMGGLEQDVYYDQVNDRYNKVAKTAAGQNVSQEAFIKRHAVLNALWPELGYRMEGVTKDGKPVISMNAVGSETPTEQEVDDWLWDNDWVPLQGEWHQGEYDPKAGPDKWRHKENGAVIGDTHAHNWRKSAPGKLLPIDVNVEAGNVAKLQRRQKKVSIVGIKHQDGNTFRFGSAKYQQLYGDVRRAADAVGMDRTVWDPSNNKDIVVGSPAENEHSTMLPQGRYMAQPAFSVVGVSNEERAKGVTFKKGQEGRVHVVTRNGKAELVPFSTWLKNESLPVVFESDDTRAMAQAAVDAINALPKSERKGQMYAPDVVRTAEGFKVVEANPSAVGGASGYLQDNPMIMDAYVSHITGREPAHVSFIRKLLSKKEAALSTDATGREHKGKGPGGGQFVSKKTSKFYGKGPDIKFPGWKLLGQYYSDVGSWLLTEGGSAALLEVPEGLTVEDVKEAVGDKKLKYVLASHRHWDHLEQSTWRKLAKAFPEAELIHPKTVKDDVKLMLGDEPLWLVSAPKHSPVDVVTVFRGVAMTGDIELGQLESVNKEVSKRTKVRTMKRMREFQDRTGYKVHSTVSAHLDDVRRDVHFPSLFEHADLSLEVNGEGELESSGAPEQPRFGRIGRP